jgi:hypothetical protein
VPELRKRQILRQQEFQRKSTLVRESYTLYMPQYVGQDFMFTEQWICNLKPNSRKGIRVWVQEDGGLCGLEMASLANSGHNSKRSLGTTARGVRQEIDVSGCTINSVILSINLFDRQRYKYGSVSAITCESIPEIRVSLRNFSNTCNGS